MKGSEQTTPPVIAILLEAFSTKSELRSVNAIIDKYIIEAIEHVQIIGIRDIDKTIAMKLLEMGKKVTCHVDKENSKALWQMKVLEMDIKPHRIPAGRKASVVLQEAIVKSSGAILAIWTGDTISNPVHMSLNLAKKLKKPMIIQTL